MPRLDPSADHLEAVGVCGDDLQRLGADRAGAAQDEHTSAVAYRARPGSIGDVVDYSALRLELATPSPGEPVTRPLFKPGMWTFLGPADGLGSPDDGSEIPADGLVIPIDVTSRRASRKGVRLPGVVVVSRDGVKALVVMLNGSIFRGAVDGLVVPAASSPAGPARLGTTSTGAVSRLSTVRTAWGSVGAFGIASESVAVPMTPGPKIGGIGGIGGSGGNQKCNWSFAKKINELAVSTPNCPRFCRKLPCPVSHSVVLKIALRTIRSTRL